jgi:hypothetical protein
LVFLGAPELNSKLVQETWKWNCGILSQTLVYLFCSTRLKNTSNTLNFAVYQRWFPGLTIQAFEATLKRAALAQLEVAEVRGWSNRGSENADF